MSTRVTIRTDGMDRGMVEAEVKNGSGARLLYVIGPMRIALQAVAAYFEQAARA